MESKCKSDQKTKAMNDLSEFLKWLVEKLSEAEARFSMVAPRTGSSLRVEIPEAICGVHDEGLECGGCTRIGR